MLMDRHSLECSAIDSLDFDLLSFKEKVGFGNVLSLITFNCLTKLPGAPLKNLRFDNQRLVCFLLKIGSNYGQNPYHNALHAADAVQQLNLYLKWGDLAQIAQLDLIDMVSIVIATACICF